jgi:hypothetical protein
MPSDHFDNGFYGQDILSVSQFDRSHLDYIFGVAHEMRVLVERFASGPGRGRHPPGDPDRALRKRAGRFLDAGPQRTWSQAKATGFTFLIEHGDIAAPSGSVMEG